MTYKEAIIKHMIWGGKDCKHPHTEILNFSEFPDEKGKLVTRTDDYVCTQCGKIWSKEEYQQYRTEST